MIKNKQIARQGVWSIDKDLLTYKIFQEYNFQIIWNDHFHS
jgi:hypothetical protein